MDVLTWLEKELNVGITDITSAAEKVGVDVVDGITFLENVLKPISADLSAVGEIIEVIDPPLASLAVAITQAVGLVKASATITGGMLSVLNNPSALAADYAALQSEYEKFKEIETAQIATIEAALAKVSAIAITAKTSTVQEIENALKDI